MKHETSDNGQINWRYMLFTDNWSNKMHRTDLKLVSNILRTPFN